ncbi:MAG: vWA domain-containing protein [Myxococcota bacterium]
MARLGTATTSAPPNPMRRLLLPTLLLACTSGAATGDRDAAADATTVDAGVFDLPATGDLDLLFVIDNSGAISGEQFRVVEEIPALVLALAEGVRRDRVTDAEVFTFPRVQRLHIGVVTMDMGAGGALVPTCRNSSFGDDGILQTRGNVASMARRCEPENPRFQVYDALVPNQLEQAEALGNDVACVAEVGTHGCGFEQPLDAALKAITPPESPLRFQEGTRGNGDVNAGFIRPGATLAIVVLTDEDDCSILDPELLDPTSTRFTGSLILRCFNHPEAVHPVSRYVEGLAAGRDPRRLVFGALVGVPVRLGTPFGEEPDFARILSDPDMIQRVDEDNPNRLETSCNVPGTGLAFPPRRLVQTAEGLAAAGAYTTVQSTCQSDYGPMVDAILERIVRSMAAHP